MGAGTRAGDGPTCVDWQQEKSVGKEFQDSMLSRRENPTGSARKTVQGGLDQRREQ